MGYRANIEAVEWFVQSVLPGVCAHVPDAVLHVVGDNPGRAMAALESSNVRIVGRVAEVEPYYRGAAVSIVPITMATGVQMKLIESLVVGVPTVSSALSARIAGVSAGKECLVADSTADWVDAVSSLLLDKELAASIATGGGKWARANYDWEHLRRELYTQLAS
jgi:glycosyltransferase involved in cell wall biosynthesis